MLKSFSSSFVFLVLLLLQLSNCCLAAKNNGHSVNTESSGSTASSSSSYDSYGYNIPDPECTGPFGLCTQQDKDRLGYQAIGKLHEKMDDDHDGQVEPQETQEFMKEELLYKSGAQDREQKFHNNDLLISVDEMWKAWKYSPVHNWTVEEIVVWVNEHVKLPQYADNFRRNRIDGQFLPRLALNENNYYLNVMQIKDPRHRRQLMIKATDLVLFGQHHSKKFSFFLP